MGAKRKFTARQLEKKVEQYFASISRMVTVTEDVPTGKLDRYGHMIFEAKPVMNALGEIAKREEFIEPPTVGGLCLFLGIHRSTWAEWCDEENYPEFADTTSRARGRFQTWQEKELLSRQHVQGIIFSLQNNYGFTEKKQVEVTGSKAQSLSIDERAQLLAEIAKEFGGGDGED